MNELTDRALRILREGGYTCVFCNADETMTQTARGITPLTDLLDRGEHLRGFCVADKVVGRGAAFCYALLQPDELYAEVLSEPAREVLERFSLPFFCGATVPAIRNRTGDGFCPMESAVRGISSPSEAVRAMKRILSEGEPTL